MAGGKLTPRQKMINLMYLVFIAMLALNMSKEVLSAFGLMSEKFDYVNENSSKYNQALLNDLQKKAEDKPELYGPPLAAANKVKPVIEEFYKYIDNIKKDIAKDFKVEESGPNKGKLPFEAMDKSNIDEVWFKGDGYSSKGKEIVEKFDKFSKDLTNLIGPDVKYQFIKEDIKKMFNTNDVINGEGVKIKFLDYHFKGFPAIASIAKLGVFQNDIKKVEQDIYNAFIGNTTTQAASLKNFQALVVLDKNVFFEGEQVTGKVVLGKYDKNTVPTSFVGPGRIENGQAIISQSAGSIGEHKVAGKFTFMEDGAPITIDFDQTYVVVPRPKTANISADKMNVVYRGVENPMTISFSGVPDNDVNAQATGLTKVGNGKYVMRPSSGGGNEVVINVTGKLSDGSTASDKKAYRIKDIPPPTGTISGQMGVIKGPKSSLEIATIGALIPGFDFEVKLNVASFALKVAGQPTVIVQGNKLNAQAKSVLLKAQKGDQVTISEINTKLVGNEGLFLQKTGVVIYEIR